MRSLSIIVPVYNESDSLQALAEGIMQHIPAGVTCAQLLFVDDGSTDASFQVIRSLSESYPCVRAVRFPVNCGKAAALEAGFSHSTGDIVITMDADLQDDPKEIPRFIAKLDEGYDLVSGWKEQRRDPWHKTIPSRFFNRVVGMVFALRLNDFNCGFKAFRGTLARQLRVYGELHRYIPVLAKYRGARIAEIPVHHLPREHGRSKYGVERLLKGCLDLITVVVTTRFLRRPLHFFGGIGLLAALIGGGCLLYLMIIWFGGVRPIGNRPLLFYGMALLAVGVQLLSLGVVAELFLRFNHDALKPVITERVGFGDE